MPRKSSSKRKKSRPEGPAVPPAFGRILGQLWSPSSVKRALGALAGLGGLWCALDWIQVDLAFAPEGLRAAALQPDWTGAWPLGPSLVVLGCLVVLTWRPGWLADSTEPAGPLHRALRQWGRWTIGLIGARLLLLWPPVGGLFPYLTLLWAPHATWAWAWAMPLFLYLRTAPEPTRSSTRIGCSTRRLALLVFGVGVAAYGGYTLYFCQVAMLHGDEAQYLRITQSLLHDGDMDLTNNLDPAYTNEFHDRPFGLHQAHQAVPGKVYSRHPIGLSVLLLPAYWVGLVLWQHPRLACALFMAFLAAGCASLSLVWLVRLGVRRAVALLCTGILMSTAPFAYYSNQLYPEMPALLIGLIVLVKLAHWLRPGGQYRSLGALEPLQLAGLALLVAGLPFLHPRFLPLGLLLAGLLGLQAWSVPRRGVALGGIGAVWGLGLVALLGHHYTFSGDWLGHFRPGAAYEEDALQAGTWLRSLPGHWLHPQIGLATAAPVFLLAPLGAAWLALQRDRRFLGLAGLYGTTTVVYGLHPDWTFGFCYPARFFVTALPALLGGLALAGPLLGRRPGAVFLAALALTISLDGTILTVMMPEFGFVGQNLESRSITSFYPWGAHFADADIAGFPWSAVFFWLPLLLFLFVGLKTLAQARPLLPATALIMAALWPAFWGQVGLSVENLQRALSGHLHQLAADASVLRLDTMAYPLNFKKELSLHNRLGNLDHTGQAGEEGGFQARAGEDKPGILASVSMHILKPGFYSIALPDIRTNAAHSPSAFLVVSLREAAPAIMPYEERIIQPLAPFDPDNLPLYGFFNPSLRSAYVDIAYIGPESLSLQTGRLLVFPQWPHIQSAQVQHLQADITLTETGPTAAQLKGPLLGPGYYRARFGVEGPVLTSTWWQRAATPIHMGVYALRAPGTPPAGPSYPFDTAPLTAGDPAFGYPLAQRLQAPWALSLPWYGRATDLHFYLEKAQEVDFLIYYDGSESIHLSGIKLYKELAN
ncbi:MAG: hypothetical protein GKR89_05225 [Candidatus Latescibacteria bacterium]|nr:hypothetical protein [Candidatus Latescibacterota bacterium]